MVCLVHTDIIKRNEMQMGLKEFSLVLQTYRYTAGKQDMTTNLEKRKKT
jgi:hypothetical protein